jgi:hypothetical protein
LFKIFLSQLFLKSSKDKQCKLIQMHWISVIVNWSGEEMKDIPLDDMGFSSARLQDVWTGTDIGHKEKMSVHKRLQT